MINALKPDPFSPLFSPLLHENLGRLPTAFFQLCGLDPLKDEGVLYEKLLRKDHGTMTKLEIYDGFGHVFWTNWPLMNRSMEFVNDTLAGVQWLLKVGTRKDLRVRCLHRQVVWSVWYVRFIDAATFPGIHSSTAT